MPEKYTPPENYAHIELNLPMENHRVILLKADKKLVSLDIGDGIILDNTLYRLMGGGYKTASDGTRIRTISAMLPDEISPKVFGKKGRLFSTIEIDGFILPQVVNK